MKKIFSLFALIILLTNCGFKVANNKELRSFDIIEVNTSGEGRINFNLKNSLKDTSIDKNKRIKLNLNTKKTKEIKEKNIKNEITKYLIILDTKVEYELVGENKRGEFSISKKGNYNVRKQYSQTLINEKNLISSLTSELIEEIINNLVLNVNDL